MCYIYLKYNGTRIGHTLILQLTYMSIYLSEMWTHVSGYSMYGGLKSDARLLPTKQLNGSLGPLNPRSWLYFLSSLKYTNLYYKF